MNPVMAAASRMLRRAQLRMEKSYALSVAEDIFTKILSVHSGGNIDMAIKLAEEKGLEVKLYDQCRIAVTGRKEKVLAFQQLLRDRLMGEELPPTEGVYVVKDLIKMSHELSLSRCSGIGREVALAIQELESFHPVSARRMQRYKIMLDSLAKQLSHAD